MRKGRCLTGWSSAPGSGPSYGARHFYFKRGPSAHKAPICLVWYPCFNFFSFSCTFSDVNSSSVVDGDFHYSFPHIVMLLPYIGNEAKQQSLPDFCMQCACRSQKLKIRPHDEKCPYQICLFTRLCSINTLSFENLG